MKPLHTGATIKDGDVWNSILYQEAAHLNSKANRKAVVFFKSI